MEIKELLIALKGEGLDGDELIDVLKQKLEDGEITQEDYDWAVKQIQEEKDKKEAFELLGV
jgi:cell division ATPase FtsA